MRPPRLPADVPIRTRQFLRIKDYVFVKHNIIKGFRSTHILNIFKEEIPSGADFLDLMSDQENELLRMLIGLKIKEETNWVDFEENKKLKLFVNILSNKLSDRYIEQSKRESVFLSTWQSDDVINYVLHEILV